MNLKFRLQIFATVHMLWPLLLLFSIAVEFHFRFSVYTYAHKIGLNLHHICLTQVPEWSVSKDILAALVCGQSLDQFSTAQLYSSAGLIHLFVVSGSHLLVLQKILSKFFSQNVNLFLLLIYGGICLFNPPVTRSLIFLMLSFSLWPTHFTLLIAGLLSLVFNPSWITSLSLQMSWIAALALLIFRERLQGLSGLWRQLLIYLLFIFCFNLLGFPALSIILLCVILTPPLEYVLFPLALITVLFHFSEPLFSILILSLNTFLKKLEYQSLPATTSIDSILILNWVLIFTSHFFIFFRKAKT